MTMSRVFVVTGSNKGIGKSIVKLLLQDKEEKVVYLTSRNQDLGQSAVNDLEKEELKASYHQLDITDKKSIEKLRDHLVEKHGGFDVLVNNAAIAYGNTAPFAEQAEGTISTNFRGTYEVCEVLFPILKKNARVVNIAGALGEFAYMKLSKEMKVKFAKPDLTMEGLQGLMTSFVQAAKDGKVQERGFSPSALATSKLALLLMTQIHQREMDIKDKNILINSCCPGSVATDFSKQRGMHVDEGADTPVYLALIPVNATSPKGSYHKFRRIYSFPPQ